MRRGSTFPVYEVKEQTENEASLSTVKDAGDGGLRVLPKGLEIRSTVVIRLNFIYLPLTSRSRSAPFAPFCVWCGGHSLISYQRVFRVLQIADLFVRSV